MLRLPLETRIIALFCEPSSYWRIPHQKNSAAPSLDLKEVFHEIAKQQDLLNAII
jgi:hypothetical protein